MADVLSFDPTLSLWLVPREDAIACGDAPGRYAEAAAAQKIFYDPLSITQDLVLDAAFEALGKSAPTVDEAFATYQQVERDVGLYRFESDGEIWHLRNRSQPRFGDPLEGRRWVLLARTQESVTRRIDLEGSEVKDALAWLPLLDGHHREAEIIEAASLTRSGGRVLEMLAAIGAFLSAPEERFAIEELPELLFMSHSSVFVRGETGSVLVDPAILTSTELLASEGRRPFEIASQIDALVVSHCHWDHLSFQTMIRIPRDTTIFVPKSRAPALVNPPLKTYLEAFGFEDVREVSDWESVTIGDVGVTFIPFFGEPFGLDSRFDAFTYLIRTNGRTIYGSLDACHDEAGDMNAIMRRLGETESIDVFLFGSSAQKHDPLYRAANMRHYSNELMRRLDLVRYHPNVDDVALWCGFLKPKTIIPYANFVYFGAHESDVRFGEASNVIAYWEALGERAPAYSRPWRDELARLTKSTEVPLTMLQPLQGLRFGDRDLSMIRR